MLGFSYIRALAESHQLKGRIVAYIPWPHIVKMASFVQNQEIVIVRLEKNGKVPQFVKVVFTSFGKDQLPGAQLEGQKVVTVKGKRSKSCDEQAPRFFGQDEPLMKPESGDGSGPETIPFQQKYRLTKAFSSVPPPIVHNLRCYLVEIRSQ